VGKQIRDENGLDLTIDAIEKYFDTPSVVSQINAVG
jgi:hypothetical protein